MAGDSGALAAEEAFAELYAEVALRMPTQNLLVACHGYGCQLRTNIMLTAGDHSRLTTVLSAGKASPAAERTAVANAVQWFDRGSVPTQGPGNGLPMLPPPTRTIQARWIASTPASTIPACSWCSRP